MNKKLDLILSKIDNVEFLSDYKNRLEELKNSFYNNAKLNIALVGEFSSGKTSLLNSLFNLNLKVDVTPQTSTIWKIFYSQDKKIVGVLFNGNKEELDSISDIDESKYKYIEIGVNNESIKDFIIVDTPGLSSLNEDHKKALNDFIDNSDVLFVVVDINQGITKTLTEYLNSQKLLNRKIYVVVTKSDLKPPTARSGIKNYILEKFPFVENIIFTSSKNKDLKDIEILFEKILKEKENILTQKLDRLLNLICANILTSIDLYIKNFDVSTEEFDKKLIEMNHEIEIIKNKLKEEEEKFENSMNSIIKESVAVFNNSLKQQKDFVIEALYDDNLDESIEDRFLKIVENAYSKSLTVIEEGLKKSLDELSKEIDNIKTSVNLDNSFPIKIANILVEMRELVVFIIFGIVAKIMDMLKLPTFLSSISEVEVIVKGVINQLLEGVTRKFVENKLNESIEEITKVYEQNLLKRLNSEVILKEVLVPLYEEMNNLINTMDKIKEDKNNTLDSSLKLLEKLKLIKDELKTVCKEKE